MLFNHTRGPAGNVSYHFPGVWPGNAYLDMLNDFDRYRRIRKDRLFLAGWSAGAQFATRFALLHPERCAAVTAFAAGGYTPPDRNVPVRFFISVGSEDTEPGHFMISFVPLG